MEWWQDLARDEKMRKGTGPVVESGSVVGSDLGARQFRGL